VSLGLVIGVVGLTSLALALLLLPLLLRHRRPAGRDDYNLAVYRDQLAEVDRDLARGLLDAGQAQAARAEIGRRILALSPAEEEARPGGRRLAAATVAVLAVPVAALAIYAGLGSPRVPDQPFADRQNGGTEMAAAGAPHVDVKKAVGELEAHLKQHPEDLTGWVLLGRSDLSLGNYPGAVDAYRHAVDLSGHRADLVGAWGEAQVMAAGGTVTPAARAAFAAALKDPESAVRSRYYLALAQMQQGDIKGALQAWNQLAQDSPKDASYMPVLRQRIAEATAAVGADPAKADAAAGGGATAAAPAAAPGAAAPAGTPNPAAVAAAAQATAGAPPEARQAMILAMVNKLAAALKEKPDNPDGWARLGRSYMVLGQPEKASAAYAEAVKRRPGDSGLAQSYAEALVAAASPEATGAPEAAVAVFRKILAAEPGNREALWYVGAAEAAAGHSDAAYRLWSRLLAELPAAAPGREALEKRLAAVKPAAK
jgi:cytochrome c-type biogenesis protein CcmH